MDWLYYIILIALAGIGLFVTLFGLPGLWLLVAGAAGYALLTDGHYLGWWSLAFLFGLALIAEILETYSAAGGARKAGASKLAMAGAIVGGLLGGIFLSFVPIPILSTIVGVCLGSFLGAAGVELIRGRHHEHSIRAGLGAAKGRFLGIIVKLAFGAVMFLATAFLGLPLGRPAPQTTPTTAPAPATPPATTQSIELEK